MSVCVISQPRFFPGLHYLHRMMVADVFVIFNTVQFNPRHEENRAKLKTNKGTQWLTVPMLQVSREQLICDTYLNQNQPWQSKAEGILKALYGKMPYYKTYAPEILSILEKPYKSLTELNLASWQPALRLLGITCQFVLASEIPVTGKGPKLLLDICKYLGLDTYLSGGFGQDYLDVTEFLDQGVEVKFHEYEYPIYKQTYGDFIPFLSYLDMLFNVDLKPDTIMAGGKIISPN
ncbi:WbqC family protein [Anabaena sp. UHCC 0451]|uniref:WbqC family protein n=1 Tax=Anabaena sp. UHCC 0451 TaxID=2055235 RepID=UPI002B1F671A|nr:WbqC family protein [Anabaena sp. UHCC 0451]MEA5579054.1 WbqC family protein [Anabaena sp. UHCC 0451]